MADVVHEHTSDNSSSGMGFFMGIVLLIIVVLLIFYFGLPYLRNYTSSPQINVPSKIDVNLNQPK